MPKTNFSPIRHGFHFSNRFVNKIFTSKLFKLETGGRCGGMAFASLDYYYSDIPIPVQKQEELINGVPQDGSFIADYIYRRQINSLLTRTSYKFITWTLATENKTMELTKEVEFKKLRKFIDRGQPVVLGLIQAKTLKEIGKNHQVIAYGYDYLMSGEIVVYIYDNNSPGEEVVLTLTQESSEFISSNGFIWRGFFVQNYKYKRLN